MTAKPFSSWLQLYVPKFFIVLREGYNVRDLRADVIAGLTVAIVALPLAMALGIASGATPEKGLVTAVIAGFLISLLGGSRVQIGGPTGAFVVVVYNIIEKFGYDGLIVATLMAGVMLIVAGLARLGDWIKYMPQPVVTGFTSGIAVIIFSSQVRDLFGLDIEKVPGEFLEKWATFWHARDTADIATIAVAAGALATLILLRRFAPKLPAFLLAVLGASIVVMAFNLPVATIGSMFGGIPHSLPAPEMPSFSLDRMAELLPSAFTIFVLAGVESLLSAVVADGMTGRRHKSNCELVGQGIANCASAFFGGLPATGAIARTATNIRSGARSPVSGMLHAVFLLLFMLVAAPLASYIPLASLAAVLVIVAWNMSEIHRFAYLLRGPWGDRIVLVLTFLLTVMVDLTVAIEVGVVLAAILFMHRMAKVVELQTDINLIESDVAERSDERRKPMRAQLPKGVEAYQIRGPFFFGVAAQLIDVLSHLNPAPKIFILRMGMVPLIDSSGVTALEEFIGRCRSQNIHVILSRVQPAPLKLLKQMHLIGKAQGVTLADNFEDAIRQSEKLLEANTQ